ncbi:MAG: hypothetical protein ACR2QC_05115 [Gammaproteobacteria bacterium]
MPRINAIFFGKGARRNVIRLAAAYIFLTMLTACGGGGNPNINSDSVGIENFPPQARTECNVYRPYRLPQSYVNALPSLRGETRINSVLIFNRPSFAVMRGGQTLAIRRSPSADAFREHDYLDWSFAHLLREAVLPGDVLKILDADPRTSLASENAPEVFAAGQEYTVLEDRTTVRVDAYFRAPEGHTDENRYLGILEMENAGCETENVRERRFVVPVRGAADEDLFVSDGGFLLRDDNMRGIRGEEFVLRRGGFVFETDANFRRPHLSYAVSPARFGPFSLRADGGWKQLRGYGHKTSFFYRQARAAFSPSPSSNAELYARFSDGAVKSEVYRNARLRGFAVGAFYRQLFRGDDSYHAGIERPTADESLKLYRVFFSAIFGGGEEYIRVNIARGLHNDKTAARIFYRLHL